MEKPTPDICRTCVEISLVWAREHPGLFIPMFIDIARYYPSNEWTHRLILSRTGYISIDITRK